MYYHLSYTSHKNTEEGDDLTTRKALVSRGKQRT